MSPSSSSVIPRRRRPGPLTKNGPLFQNIRSLPHTDTAETGPRRLLGYGDANMTSEIQCRQLRRPCAGRATAGPLRMTCWLAVQLWLAVALTAAETPRSGRRHLGRDSTQRPVPFSVDTCREAVTYLEKYGYLDGSTGHRRRRHIDDDVTVREGGRSRVDDRRLCDSAEIRRAVRVLQATLRLQPTGLLDVQTRRAMSSRRCGNDDVAAVVAAAATGRDRRDATVQRFRQRRSRHRRGRRTSYQDGRRANAAAGPRSAAPVPVAAGLIREKIPTRRDEWSRREQMLRQINARVTAEMHRPTTARERSMASAVSRLATARRIRKRRSLRAVSIDQVFEGPGGRTTRFPKDRPVRWRLLDDGFSSKIPLADQKSRLELSFRMWSEVTPIKFVEDRQTSILDIDILIAFGKRQHMNCDKPFDGLGGELAHSWAAGDIHFDDDEDYRADVDLVSPGPSTAAAASGGDRPSDETAISLQKLAVHEVGHVLGLLHNDIQHSIMYPIYVSPSSPDDFELVREDRQAVQQIYGVCKGTFDVAFDWLRRSTDSAASEPTGRSIYIYNTYFFRGSRYWMYENQYNRTRYGDPLLIDDEWTGLPPDIDAFMQVIATAGADYAIDTYFFKGDVYYKYNDELARVEDGYPRRISDDFGAGPGSSDAIPDNLDAIWFDIVSSQLYFFKGEWVWVYDAAQIGRSACCSARQLFVDLFPMVPGGGSSSTSLTGHIDSVHYSYHSRAVFFFAGEAVFHLVPSAGDQAAAGGRWWAGLQEAGPWYNIWYDICDVE